MNSVSNSPDEAPRRPGCNFSDWQQRLVKQHELLMTVYVYAVDQVRGENPLPKTTDEPHDTSETTQKYNTANNHGAITRALVEAHIKHKISELKVVYVYLEQSLTEAPSVHNMEVWLHNAQEALTRFSATLVVLNSVRRLVAILWPLVIALVAIASIWNALFKLLGQGHLGFRREFIVLTPLVSLFILILFRRAAIRKREFFLSPVLLPLSWVDNFRATPAAKVTVKNIYAAEDELFDIISRPKRKEVPLDTYALGACFFMGAAECLGFILTFRPHRPNFFDPIASESYFVFGTTLARILIVGSVGLLLVYIGFKVARHGFKREMR